MKLVLVNDNDWLSCRPTSHLKKGNKHPQSYHKAKSPGFKNRQLGFKNRHHRDWMLETPRKSKLITSNLPQKHVV
ncbi:MAG: hypothetical protein HDT06_05780 [Bacteroidales bacterium]|nr:hypothetical protein [Bacteroidales bacterium]